MEERIIQFVKALRNRGVPVSLAESIDSFNAINELGIHERENFRISLRASIIKNQSHLGIFDELFPLFFNNTTSPPLINLVEDLSPEEASMIAEAIRRLNENIKNMMERLVQGESLSEEELERFAQRIGLQHANNPQYQEWMIRRMEQALRFEEVREAIRQLTETLLKMSMKSERLGQIQDLLEENFENLREQIRQFVGKRIAENLSETPRRDSIEQLMTRNFTALSERDMQILRDEIRRLAAILRSRIALRQKRAKNGRLDPKATIRANLRHQGVPFEIKYHNRRRKPKLVVFCDISTSMRYCSELMLSLVYELKDQITKTHAFAFIDHLKYINPDFSGKQASEAVQRVLNKMPPGYYSTDLGYSLTNFASEYMDTVDSKTTFIMVGDARNNYNNPAIEIFKTIAQRAHRTIWINPEARIQWGSGDSDMWKYEPFCDDILRASTLKELTAAVDKLLG
jgi:uncharacterized protein with von Willebrand factor type A (vWA) domain